MRISLNGLIIKDTRRGNEFDLKATSDGVFDGDYHFNVLQIVDFIGSRSTCVAFEHQLSLSLARERNGRITENIPKTVN